MRLLVLLGALIVLVGGACREYEDCGESFCSKLLNGTAPVFRVRMPHSFWESDFRPAQLGFLRERHPELDIQVEEVVRFEQLDGVSIGYDDYYGFLWPITVPLLSHDIVVTRRGPASGGRCKEPAYAHGCTRGEHDARGLQARCPDGNRYMLFEEFWEIRQNIDDRSTWWTDSWTSPKTDY